MIAEYPVSAGTTLDKLQRTYAWGIDLASSLTKAGGVGALLQFANMPTGQTYLPTYDGNGNVASLVNLGTGALAAGYEYTPFGEMLRDEVLDNAVSTCGFKFSTKWRDAETGWSYYRRRYYDARMGRFIGRDPVGEQGGTNLYGFVGNNSVNLFDYLGMDYWDENGSLVDEIASHWSEGDPGFFDENGVAWRQIRASSVSLYSTRYTYSDGSGRTLNYIETIENDEGYVNDFRESGLASNPYAPQSYVIQNGKILAAVDSFTATSIQLANHQKDMVFANLSNSPADTRFPRISVIIGTLQSYSGPNEGAFYIPVPIDASDSAGMLDFWENKTSEEIAAAYGAVWDSLHKQRPDNWAAIVAGFAEISDELKLGAVIGEAVGIGAPAAAFGPGAIGVGIEIGVQGIAVGRTAASLVQFRLGIQLAQVSSGALSEGTLIVEGLTIEEAALAAKAAEVAAWAAKIGTASSGGRWP